MQRFVVLLMAAMLSIGSGAVAGAAPPAQGCPFVFGFADLKAAVGAPMGEPVTCEYPDPLGTGDVQQNTTTGLAFWRRFTNTPTFTDGHNHWALAPGGLVTWTGAGIDPPGTQPPPAQPLARSTATPMPTPTQEATFSTRNGLKTLSQMRAELVAAGYGGPFNAQSLHTAYDRATAPTATLTSTPTPMRTDTPTHTPTPAFDVRKVCADVALTSIIHPVLSYITSDQVDPLLALLVGHCVNAFRTGGADGADCFNASAVWVVRTWALYGTGEGLVSGLRGAYAGHTRTAEAANGLAPSCVLMSLASLAPRRRRLARAD